MRGLTRRVWLRRTLAALGGMTLGGCEPIEQSDRVNSTLAWADAWTYAVQRLLLGRAALAREYREQDISRDFRANGTTDPNSTAYNALARAGFADWRLIVDGLVQRPLRLSLDELRRMPSRTQITRHDCVEGWSCIGKWKGVPLSSVLRAAGLAPRARFLAFYCADTLEVSADDRDPYYETIDLVDAMHPQTLLAFEMNDRPLPIAHGAPLRLRVERQLGYKMAKYIMRIEAIESFAELGQGKGGYWEDRGYQWYAGI
jgi:DMSO/TMAO reductase YedYZ molybdopterin-dependent catalytic subunit